jgi:MFS family permease
VTSPAGDPATVTAPIPVVSGPVRWRDTFITLSNRNFRIYAATLFIGSVGGWMSRIAIDWLVLELTGDIALVGLVLTFQLAPTLLLSAWAGVLADRYRRRLVVIVAQSIAMVSAAALAVLVLIGVAEVWHVFAAALLTGVSQAVDGPSRIAFLSELVGIGRMRNAIVVASMAFNGAGLVGPALSGLLIAVAGSGWSIAISVVTTLIGIIGLIVIRPGELTVVPPQQRAKGQIREAVRYMVRKPTIFWPSVLLFFGIAFAMTLPVVLAAAASDQGFDLGPEGYGYFTALASIGALVGAALAAQHRSMRLRTVVFWAAAYGVATALLGVIPIVALFIGIVIGISIIRLIFVVAGESMILLSTNPGVRGRVMSLYLLIVVSGQAAGSVFVGFIAQAFGWQVAAMIAGGVPALAALVVALILADRHQLRLRVNVRNPRQVVTIVPRSRIDPGEPPL